MNNDFINPILGSMVNVISTMAMLEVKPAKISLKKNALAFGDVSGVIGMMSPKARGSLAISFPEATILDITQKMLGEPVSEIDDTVTDLVGEITNMVTGSAKQVLENKGFDFAMALPTIVCGKNHKIIHSVQGDVVVIPFDIEAGTFFAEICFNELH